MIEKKWERASSLLFQMLELLKKEKEEVDRLTKIKDKLEIFHTDQIDTILNLKEEDFKKRAAMVAAISVEGGKDNETLEDMVAARYFLSEAKANGLSPNSARFQKAEKVFRHVSKKVQLFSQMVKERTQEVERKKEFGKALKQIFDALQNGKPFQTELLLKIEPFWKVEDTKLTIEEQSELLTDLFFYQLSYAPKKKIKPVKDAPKETSINESFVALWDEFDKQRKEEITLTEEQKKKIQWIEEKIRYHELKLRPDHPLNHPQYNNFLRFFYQDQIPFEEQKKILPNSYIRFILVKELKHKIQDLSLYLKEFHLENSYQMVKQKIKELFGQLEYCEKQLELLEKEEKKEFQEDVAPILYLGTDQIKSFAEEDLALYEEKEDWEEIFELLQELSFGSYENSRKLTDGIIYKRGYKSIVIYELYAGFVFLIGIRKYRDITSRHFEDLLEVRKKEIEDIKEIIKDNRFEKECFLKQSGMRQKRIWQMIEKNQNK